MLVDTAGKSNPINTNGVLMPVSEPYVCDSLPKRFVAAMAPLDSLKEDIPTAFCPIVPYAETSTGLAADCGTIDTDGLFDNAT